MLKKNKFTVKVLSHDIKVRICNPNIWADGALGRAYLTKQRVLLSNKLTKDVKGSTLLHEITHIIDNLLTLNMTESQVDGIAVGMYSLIKENKQLIRELADIDYSL